MCVRHYAQAVLRRTRKTFFLEDALLKAGGAVPSNLGFHRNSWRIVGSTIGNNNSSRYAIEQRRRVPSVEAGLPDNNSTGRVGSIVSLSRCVGRGYRYGSLSQAPVADRPVC